MERVKKELNVQVGRRLREIRENMGYTQFRFAEILGVVEEHYRKIDEMISRRRHPVEKLARGKKKEPLPPK